MKHHTITQFKKRFPDDLACLQYMLDSRYGSTCPYCLETVTFYKMTNRKAYSCGKCRAHVYPLADTIFHNSRTSLWSWFYALYIFAVSKNGVAAMELQRHLGVTYKCAWRMAKQIRSLMYQDNYMFSGIVEADEAYWGGRRSPKKRFTNKVAIMGAVERGGRAMAVVTGKPSSRFATQFFAEQVAPGSRAVTDESHVYHRLSGVIDHTKIRHAENSYKQTPGEDHTNTVEGMWSLMKNSMAGTYHYVSDKYLQYYIDEFVFHYNRDGWDVFHHLLQRASQLSTDGARWLLLWGLYMAYRDHELEEDWPDAMVALLSLVMVRQPEPKRRRKHWLQDVWSA